METKYLIVISFDAVSSEDINKLKKLNNFKYLIDNGSLITNVESVYPTLTYPAHATIMTGRYPKNHGIINNTLNKFSDVNPNWYWYRKYIKATTLYDLAYEKGLTTAALLWPVSGRSNITYNLTEIFAPKPWQNQLVMSALSGSVKYQLDLNKRFGHLRKGLSQPALDNFVHESVKYTISKYKPNLLLIHYTDVDTNRHYHGYNSKEANDALFRHNERLGEIIDTLKKANIFEESTIVALGDHSALDGDYMIRLNSLFRQAGLIKVNKKGIIKSYKAVAKSCDGSSYVYLKNKNDTETYKKVTELLENLKNSKDSPIDFILTSDEAEKEGADPTCSFMVEGNNNYYFVDEALGSVIEKVKEKEIGKISHRTKATHGYHPKKPNYNTFFLAYGKGIKKGLEINGGKLINHGPTLAKILGVNFGETDGKIEEGIFEL
ncbi:MAG: ectonucleotide pyrophosphatase/phosphodiesterase [Clostridium sp.]|uniref:alkaline phosphatase family protein n=1 Tax=Clostridium sp. TaxID=1506 RepID=UPI0025BD7667|nr:ectonucleotide pyrophosphatase/phosphodiesterase [Clostridium sp.]MDY2630788.1 ectonucleotide pyrophosphatase/phosphodiesterase [Clostridium sp.]MDY6227015.1 ectonucleotide pyrophosphatase/phosphodiesterase [Clostridium sp.]